MSRLKEILKEKASETLDNGIRNIYYKEIMPSPNNKFGIRDIEDLAEDIAATGLDHNIVIRPIDHADYKYEIIAGERRYTAICSLIEQGNLTYEYIPAKVVKLDDNKSRKKLILNNLMGRTITPEEMLQAVADLEELYAEEKKSNGLPGRVQHLIAGDVGLKPTQVGYYQRINHKAIPEIKDMVVSGELTITEGAELASLNDEEQLQFVHDSADGEITLKTVKEYKDQLSNVSVSDTTEKKETFIDKVESSDELIIEDVSVNDTKVMPIVKKEVIDEELGADDFIRIDEVAIELEDYESENECVDDYDFEEENQELNITELVIEINDYIQQLDKKLNGVEFRKEKEYLMTVIEDFDEFRKVLGV